MVATLKGSRFRNKSEFLNGMKESFLNFWNTLPEDVRKGFLDTMTESGDGVGQAIEMPIMNTGKTFFRLFIDHWEQSGVELIFSRPKTIPSHILLDYRSKKTIA
jgi:hypothetical protein